MAQREMYDGNGPGSKMVRKVAGITALPGGDNTFTGTERNIIQERPFVDRSNPNQPKSQIFGAVKDRISNFFQPGDPGYNYDTNDTALTPTSTSTKQPISDVAAPVAAPLSVSVPALPNKIRGFSNRQNADGSGTLTRPHQAPRRTITSPPAAIAPAPAPVTAVAAQPISAGYGEYSGDPDSRIYAGPPAPPQQVAAIAAAPAPQTTTVGYGHGVYELAPGQNAPPDFSTMSLGDMAAYKFGVNQQVKQAGIANVNSEITNRQAITQMAQQEQPYKIAGTIADTRNKNFATDNGIVMSPLIQENTKATTDHTKASTLDILEMMDPKKNTLLADTRYKYGMLKIAGDKLGILKEQIALRAKQAATKGNAADWGGISKSALEGIKLIDAKGVLGGLTPEDEQLRKNYLDTYNLAFPRQQRTAYQQPAIAIDGGE